MASCSAAQIETHRVLITELSTNCCSLASHIQSITRELPTDPTNQWYNNTCTQHLHPALRPLPVEACELVPCWWQRQLQQLDAAQDAVGQQLQQPVVAAGDAQDQHQAQACMARLQDSRQAADLRREHT